MPAAKVSSERLPFPQPGRFEHELVLALKARRERSGLSCVELGRLAGLGDSYISKMECGHINIQISTVLKLVQIIDSRIGVSPDAVLELQKLSEIVEDLCGWAGSTSDSLKREWVSTARASRKRPGPRAVTHLREGSQLPNHRNHRLTMPPFVTRLLHP